MFGVRLCFPFDRKTYAPVRMYGGCAGRADSPTLESSRCTRRISFFLFQLASYISSRTLRLVPVPISNPRGDTETKVLRSRLTFHQLHRPADFLLNGRCSPRALHQPTQMDKMQPNSLSHVPTAFVHDVLIKLGALLFFFATSKGCSALRPELTKRTHFWRTPRYQLLVYSPVPTASRSKNPELATSMRRSLLSCAARSPRHLISRRVTPSRRRTSSCSLSTGAHGTRQQEPSRPCG